MTCVVPPLPTYVQFFQERPLPAELVEASARGEYEVRGRLTRVVPPVDWRMDPIDNHSWRFWFHTLQFLEYPLRLYLDRGDVDELRRALALVLDWVAQNDPDADTAGDHAWYDMSVGVRAPFLAFTWRAARHEGLLRAEDDETLRGAIHRHASWLMEEENYRAHSNHGLYEDAGLFLMASWADELPESTTWRAFAESRFLRTLNRHVHPDEGLHLEQSPGYHLFIRDLLVRLSETTGIGGAELAVLIDRMDRVAPWLVLPDGSQLPFGDTDPSPALRWASALPVQHGMLALVRSGLMAVRHGGSHLAVTGAYHSRTHKHADELSWTLFDHGRLLIGEAGRYGYRSEEDPHRIHARGAQGHNTLVVDGASFDWYGSLPYGAALEAAGAGGGWYAVTGSNPLVGAHVVHRRTLLHRPGFAVVVVDELARRRETDPERAPALVERRVHAGLGIAARRDEQGVALVDEEGTTLAEIRDWSGSDEPVLAHGRTEPRLEGFAYPRELQVEPAWVVVLRGPYTEEALVHGVAVAPHRLVRVSAVRDGGGLTILLDWGDGTEAVRVVRDGATLAVGPA